MQYTDLSLAFLSLIFILCCFSAVFFLFKKKSSSFFVFSGFEAMHSKNRKNLITAFYVLFSCLGLVFLLMSMARPQERILEKRKVDEGVDILFVLDLSDSMLIEDMKPYENRLESAKAHIKSFIEKRPSDRMGLVVFSGEAYTRVPLTIDHALLLYNLKGLGISDYMKKGTAIGVALAAAVNRTRDSKAKSKVVVLLTDGENNTGVIDPLTALDLAVEEGAKVYTIGIGRDGQSMLPVFRKDRLGRKIKTYRPFPTQINEDLLKKIAQKTGGAFYRASTEKEMDFIFKSIDGLERSEIDLPKQYRVDERFQEPLVLGLLCFFVLFLAEVLFFWRGL